MTASNARRSTHRLPILWLTAVLTGCGTPPEIEREPPAEAKLATQVKIALVDEPTLDAAAIFVDATGDVIELSGFTDNPEQRERAVQVAQGVPGVARVENAIEIR